MKETLIIVESPSKAKTIQTYLGSETKVLSSVGHIRELATTGVGGLGIDIENAFTPKYVVSTKKKKVVTEIKKEAKGKRVLIATDQDREGEAIGWHLAQILNLDLNEENRVVFSEITKNTIQEAIKHPRKIDVGLVNSQEARRMLDRIIGFKLSGLLQSKLKSKSAGRVQSVALKLIVDLEKEILAFVPVTYYDIEATFNQIKASQQHVKKKLNLEEVNHILKQATNPFVVSNIETKENVRKPKKPYITSTLQQDAFQHLGFSATKTMMLAQILYEGVKIDGDLQGLITYMRTDSNRLSKDFYEPALDHIQDLYGQEYMNKYEHNVSSNAQDAHEAIRPTKVHLTPEYVRANVVKSSFKKADLFEPAMKLYERIYFRTLSSLMTPAKFLKTKVTVESHNEPFLMEGIQVIFDGFTKVYDDVNTKDVILPSFKMGQELHADEVISIEKQTQPKSRFNEGSLIKRLDKLGIGRPSTYATILKTLEDRHYVKKKDGKYEPTEQGNLTSEALDQFFQQIINVEYTAEMEDHLDKIAEGTYDRNDILRTFYDTFEPMLEHAKTNMQKVQPEMLDALCPECGSPLVKRKSRFGEFTGCSNYPTCKYNDLPKKEKPELKTIGKECPQCGKPLVVRTSKKGDFIGCSGFPKCRHVEQIESKEVESNEKTSA